MQFFFFEFLEIAFRQTRITLLDSPPESLILLELVIRIRCGYKEYGVLRNTGLMNSHSFCLLRLLEAGLNYVDLERLTLT